MNLKSISGTWITSALQWHQDLKHRYICFTLLFTILYINRVYSHERTWKNKRAVVLSESLWRTSAVCRGTDRSNTSWPQPARVAGPQCGTSARTTSSLKSATTATEYVLPPALTQSLTHPVLLNLLRIVWCRLLDWICLQSCVLFCFFRCIARGWPGTQKLPLSWSWPRRTTGCRSSRCGTYVLLPLLWRF